MIFYGPYGISYFFKNNTRCSPLFVVFPHRSGTIIFLVASLTAGHDFLGYVGHMGLRKKKDS